VGTVAGGCRVGQASPRTRPQCGRDRLARTGLATLLSGLQRRSNITAFVDGWRLTGAQRASGGELGCSHPGRTPQLSWRHGRRALLTRLVFSYRFKAVSASRHTFGKSSSSQLLTAIPEALIANHRQSGCWRCRARLVCQATRPGSCPLLDWRQLHWSLAHVLVDAHDATFYCYLQLLSAKESSSFRLLTHVSCAMSSRLEM